MKRFLPFLFIAFWYTQLWAQNPVVTATITGTDGCPYKLGTYNFSMVDGNGNDLTPGAIIHIGSSGIPTYIRNIQGTLDGFGKLNVSVLANNLVTQPTGTQWRIAINSQNPQTAAGTIPPMQSFKYIVTINSTVDLTAALSTLAPPLGCGGGGGGGGTPGGTNLQVQFNNGGHFGGTIPTYDPSVNAFNNLVQFQNPLPLGSVPSLPGSNFFGKVASQYISETYTAPLTVNQANNTLGIYNDFLDGGVQQNQDGLALKPGIQPLNISNENHSKGSSNPIILNNYQYGLGDTFGLFNFASCWGGTSANGDEGCENNDEWALQGTVDYDGTITGTIATGATSVTVNPTQGSGTQGTGRWLLDLNAANLITAGTITGMSGGSTTFTTMTGTGTGWAISTVNTTLGTAVTSIGSATVTPASMTGITTSTVLCIADAGNFQTVIPTSTTGTTFTAFFNKPQLSTAIVASGGNCGYSIGFTVDNVSGTGYTGTLLFVYPVIRSTSSTSMDVWIAGAGVYTNYTGSWSAGTYNTYTLYPGAEVLHVNNGGTTLSNTLTLAPNTVQWVTGDTVDQPMYPYITQSGGNNVLSVSGGGGNKVGRVYSFNNNFWRGAGGQVAAFLLVNNNTSPSAYGAAKNRSSPYGIWYTGEWDDAIKIPAPDTSVFYISGCAASGTCGSFNWLFSNNNTNQQDTGSYNQLNGSWNFTAGFKAANVQFSPTGSIATPGDVSGGKGEFGTAQNLILQSQFPSGTSAPWVSQGTLALQTVTPNNAADPNGNITAETVVAPAVMGTTDSSGQAQTVSGLTNGGFYTETVCFKSHDGAGELIEVGPVGDAVHSSTVTLSDTNYHCLSTPNFSPITYTSAAWSWVFLAGGANQGATIDVAFAQLEPTAYHAQYIATTSSAVTVTGTVTNNVYVSALAGASIIAANAQGKLIQAPGGGVLTGGVLGSVPYQSAPNTTLFVAPNTTATTLCFTQTGTGSVGAAPAWASCAGSTSVNFSALVGSTNTTAAMLVGTGASLGPTGTGTVTANALSGTPTIPNGSVATTQSVGDTSAKVATDAFVVANSTQTLCHGTITVNPGAITSGSVSSAITATCTGLATTDNIQLTFNADPTSTTGYAPSTNGTVTLISYPTTNTINVKVENNTLATITPGSVTLNYRVVR